MRSANWQCVPHWNKPKGMLHTQCSQCSVLNNHRSYRRAHTSERQKNKKQMDEKKESSSSSIGSPKTEKESRNACFTSNITRIDRCRRHTCHCPLNIANSNNASHVIRDRTATIKNNCDHTKSGWRIFYCCCYFAVSILLDWKRFGVCVFLHNSLLLPFSSARFHLSICSEIECVSFALFFWSACVLHPVLGCDCSRWSPFDGSKL